MIVDFINILVLKTLILQLSMKCLPVLNDCELYIYVRMYVCIIYLFSLEILMYINKTNDILSHR